MIAALRTTPVVVALAFALAAGAGCGDAKKAAVPPIGQCTTAADCDAGFMCELPAGRCVPATGDIDFDPGDMIDPPVDIAEPDDNAEPDDADDPNDNVESDADETGDDTNGRDLLVSPDRFDFGAVLLGRSATAEVRLTNVGTGGPLTITQIRFRSIPPPAEFRLEVFVRDDTGARAPRSAPIVLAPGASVYAAVTYTPVDERPDENEFLQVLTDDVDRPEVLIPLAPEYKGTAILAADPASVDFGRLPVGASEFRTLVIRNAGDTAGNRVLKVAAVFLQSSGGLTGNSYLLRLSRPVSRAAPAFLNPGESFEVTITFSPLQPGAAARDTVFIESSDPSQPAEGLGVPLNGESISSDLVVSPSIVDFGVTETGATKRQLVTALNTGNTPLTIFAIAMQTSGPQFAVEPPPGNAPWVLNGTESLQFTVVYTPAAEGDDLNRAIITNSGEVRAYPVVVQGRAGSPKIRIASSTPNPDPADPTPALDFGRAQLGRTARGNVTAINEGSVPLRIARIELDAASAPGFALIDDPQYYVQIDPGFSRTITFGYTPAALGVRFTGAAKIFSNAGNAQADGSVPLKLFAAATDPTLVVAPTQIRFRAIAAGRTDDQVITIDNGGTGELTIFNVALTAGSARQFRLNVGNNTFPQRLAAGGRIEVTASFAPAQPVFQEITGGVAITHDDADLVPAGADRADFVVPLSAPGTLNNPPVCTLKANDQTGTVNAPFGENLVLFADCTDPDTIDQGTLTFTFETVQAPDPARQGPLTGRPDDAVRTVIPDLGGAWTFRVQAADRRGGSSNQATVSVIVAQPDMQFRVVLDSVSWVCGLTNLEMSAPQAAPPLPTCANPNNVPLQCWPPDGPTHSGLPRGLPFGEDNASSITWDGPNRDGTYVVSLKKLDPLSVFGCGTDILCVLGRVVCGVGASTDSMRLNFFRKLRNEPQWKLMKRCTRTFNLFGSSNWDFQAVRAGGAWSRPNSLSPDASCEDLPDIPD